ncbi:hypothetical protein DFH06DRAFT_1234980 [Mycena polygramma]|nr:hypothetical protein DFH06DRAFT_1234980 [Mycena polygramma]
MDIRFLAGAIALAFGLAPLSRCSHPRMPPHPWRQESDYKRRTWTSDSASSVRVLDPQDFFFTARVLWCAAHEGTRGFIVRRVRTFL